MLLAWICMLPVGTSSQVKKKKSKEMTLVNGPKETAIVGTFYFLGPFGVGKTEIDSDPIAAFGGIRNVSRGSKKRTFVSELAEGGRVGWTRLHAQPTGAIRLQFPLGDKAPVNFGRTVQALNRIAALEMQGWLLADFAVAATGRYLVRCAPAHHVELDDDHVLLHGDVYSRGFAWSAVQLTEGKHTLYIRVRAKGSAVLSCAVRAAPNDSVELYPSNSPAPDIVASTLVGTPPLLAFHVLNTGSTWRELSLQVSRSELPRGAARSWAKASAARGLVPRMVNAVNESQWVAPGQALLLRAHVSLDAGESGRTGVDWAESAPSDGDCLLAWLHVVDAQAGEIVSKELRAPTLRCRRATQSFVFTFRDHDGSVAHAAAVRPWEACTANRHEEMAARGCGILVSLSGVGATPNDQADSHKFVAQGARPGNFTFGCGRAWVLAPQREGAHNWEGTGFHTAQEAVVALARLSREHPALVTYAADSRRLLFAGHSRGGHGAYMMSMHHPDWAVAVAALSGWWRREQYGDANIMFDLDLQLSFMEPALRAVLEAAITDHDSSQLAANLRGLPVMLRSGGDDASVPAYHTRRMARLLLELGVNTTFVELPGKPHWWWDTNTESDGGVMHDDQMRAFYAHLEQPLPPFPATTELVTYNPSTHLGRGGVRVLQQIVPFRRSMVRVSRVSRGLRRQPDAAAAAGFRRLEPVVLRVTTVNVRRIAFCDAFRRWDGAGWWQDGGIRVVVEQGVGAEGGASEGGAGSQGLVLPTDLVQRLVAGGCGVGGDGGGHDAGVQGGGGDATLTLLLDSGRWRVVEDPRWLADERSPANYGPARQVLSKPFLIVVGTRAEPAVTARLLAAAVYLSTGHAMASETVAAIVNDSALTQEMAVAHNLVILGGPHHNALTMRLATAAATSTAASALEFGGHGSNGGWMRLGSCWLAHEDGAVLTYPRHLAGGDSGGASGRATAPRLDLYVVASDMAVLEALLRYSFSLQQALTRAPYSNMVPDFMVAGPEYAWKGYGGLKAAGFWSNTWTVAQEASYSACA